MLIIFIPLLFYSYTQAEASARASATSFVDNYADTLAKATEMVYFSGEGSYVDLYINVPEHIKSIKVDKLNGKSILVITATNGQIVKYSSANIIIKNADKLQRQGMKSIHISYQNGAVYIE